MAVGAAGRFPALNPLENKEKHMGMEKELPRLPFEGRLLSMMDRPGVDAAILKAERDAALRREFADIEADPAGSHALKDWLKTALARDPLDAYLDACWLTKLMAYRLANIQGRWPVGTAPVTRSEDKPYQQLMGTRTLYCGLGVSTITRPGDILHRSCLSDRSDYFIRNNFRGLTAEEAAKSLASAASKRAACPVCGLPDPYHSEPVADPVPPVARRERGTALGSAVFLLAVFGLALMYVRTLTPEAQVYAAGAGFVLLLSLPALGKAVVSILAQIFGGAN